MSDTENMDWQELDQGNGTTDPQNSGDGAEGELEGSGDLEAVFDVPVKVSAVLGITNLTVSQLLKLGSGSVVELDRKVGEAIDIYVNNRLVARGEVVLLEEKLGITMTEIIKGNE
ncbi:flagellar motor switch protein FliN [Paremcibacter congregatus]|uniref:Flagellar motor switch protein FliN n=1 Tax=Paremcibacter congregatus TaxID=2043170 RepID=A0A2G4YSF5_9PROT|nr:flagellar motor switch protein FliN [Paremcibacter congregatus]PHZ85258.1 flagellar motor switch protein FliN [Paremcibacter congregatus]QDE27810.1 flagellar motor switch protein FliN [Paremcibacter congregatus]